MLSLLLNPTQIITINSNGNWFKRGKDLGNIEPVFEHSIIIEDGIIKDILPDHSIKNLSDYNKIDLKNKIILPGLIECHTHTVFAGSRAEEFRKKLSGVSYEEIAKSGGGILSTVKAVREYTFEELVNIVKPRIDYFISQGITTLEIKSGYGLDFENEIKILHVIKYLNEIYPVDIIPTFLGAHTYPSEFKDNHEGYVNEIINKMIPHIAKNKLAEFCDGFCEKTAFSSEEIDRIFTAAVSNNLKLKLHTEQFNNIGGLDVALKHNASSIDHLEVLNETDLKKAADSETVCTLLPGVSFFLNYQSAPARKLIDNNAIIALATDYNPGSSHIANLNFIMSLAALKMNMTIEETVSAVTINAAHALGLSSDRGSIEIGKKADFSVFDTNEYSDIVYNVGKNLNCMTIKAGNIIYSSQ